MVGRKKKPKICDKGSQEDVISQLPDHLICHILTHLSTWNVVRTSLLSKRWRSLWKHVPDLDVDSHAFSNFDAFISFVDRFFDSHKESRIRKLQLCIRRSNCVDDASYLTPWIDTAITHKIQHLDVRHLVFNYMVPAQIPLSLYTCETLVHLRLFWSILVNDAEFVSLPCLKIMQLEYVRYPKEAILVNLILGSPVLEDLTVIRHPLDKLKVLKVCSQTLKIVYIDQCNCDEQIGVVIDAPLLQFLRIKSSLTESLKIINLCSTPKVDIDIFLRELYVSVSIDSSKISMIRNFLASISRARCLVISHATVKVISQLKNLEHKVQFCYLSELSASFCYSDLKMLPSILISCPKLKSLILELVGCPRRNKEPEVMFSSVPPCLISSLMFVEVKSPIVGYEGEIKLVRYFLKNSRILEKLSVRFDTCYRIKAKYVILQELLAIPRCSSTCEVVVL